MDRIDAMKVFVAALDEGSLAAAGRKLGRSPAAVSRALAFLEGRVGVPLLHRTTRSSQLSEAGTRYAALCRRVLSDLHDADILVASERTHPGGTLTMTAPVSIGEELLRPIMDDFLDAFPKVTVRLMLLDRPVNLVDERVDVALRIGHLPDSAMIAIRVGEVRRIIVASPSYLEDSPRLEQPRDLANHRIIAVSDAEPNSWDFPPSGCSMVPRSIALRPRFVVNSTRAAVASAVEGRGVTRLLSYQVANHMREGTLQVALAGAEHPPLPIHLMMPEGRITVPTVRAFVDFSVPKLRAQLAQLQVGQGCA